MPVSVPNTNKTLKKDLASGKAESVSNPSDEEIRRAIEKGAFELGIDPVDYATAISYETGGTFHPWQSGPTTQYGQHRGTIQYGEPQRKQYGVYKGQSFEDQVTRSNVKYLKNAGVKPGASFDALYAAINAGRASAPLTRREKTTGRTVADNIRLAKEGHRDKVIKRFGFNPQGGNDALTRFLEESLSSGGIGDEQNIDIREKLADFLADYRSEPKAEGKFVSGDLIEPKTDADIASDEEPIPESGYALVSQLESARDPRSPKSAVLFTNEESIKTVDPKYLVGLDRVMSPKGVMFVNTAKIPDYRTRTMTELLGIVEDVDNDTKEGFAVRSIDSQGRELFSAKVTTEEAARKQQVQNERMFPGSKTEIVTTDAVRQIRVNDILTEFRSQADYPAYKKFIDEVGGFEEGSPESIKAFNEAQTILARQGDITAEEYEKSIKDNQGLIPRAPSASTRASLTPLAEDGLTVVVQTPKEIRGSARKYYLDDLARQTAELLQVDYDTARQYLSREEGLNEMGTEARFSATYKTGQPAEITLTSNAIEQLKAIDKEVKLRKQKEATLKEEYLKTIDPNQDAPDLYTSTIEQELLAKADAGLTTREEAYQTYLKIKEATEAWKNDTGFFTIFDNEEWERIRTILSGVIAGGVKSQLGTSLSSETIASSDTAYTNAFAKMLKQYGTPMAWVEAQKDFKKRFKDKESLFVAKVLESAAGGAIKAPFEGAASLLESMAIGHEAVQRAWLLPRFGDISADKKAVYKFGEALRGIGEAIGNVDKDFKEGNAELFGNTFGQIVTQIGLGVVTGTAVAPALLGASLGAASAYRNIGEFNTEQEKLGNPQATPWQRLGATVGAAALAAPEYFIFRYMQKGAGAFNQLKFVQSMRNSAANYLIKQGATRAVASSSAVEVADGVLAKLISSGGYKAAIGKGLQAGQQFGKRAIISGLGETVQEVSENHGNNLIAYITYDPRPERWDAFANFQDEDFISGVAGFFGGVLGASFHQMQQRAAVMSVDAREQALEIIIAMQNRLPLTFVEDAIKALEGTQIAMQNRLPLTFVEDAIKALEGTQIEPQAVPKPPPSLSLQAETPETRFARKAAFGIEPPKGKTEPSPEKGFEIIAAAAKQDDRVERRRAEQQVETERRIAQTERRRADEEGRRADTSPVTGLPNKNALERARARVEADPNTEITSIDLNNFKAINDKNSHIVGDRALKEAGQDLLEAAKKIDPSAQVMHLSGDEFAVISPKGTGQNIVNAADTVFSRRKYGEVSGSISGNTGQTYAEAESGLQAAKDKRKGLSNSITESKKEGSPASTRPGKISPEVKPSAEAEISGQELISAKGSPKEITVAARDASGLRSVAGERTEDIEIEFLDPDTGEPFKTNASGESAASVEAQNRLKAEKKQGVYRVKVDTRSGRETIIPLTVDAADVHLDEARNPQDKYFTIEWRGGDKDGHVIEHGSDVKKYTRAANLQQRGSDSNVNTFTQNNLDNVLNRSKIDQAVGRVIQSLRKILPSVKIVLHENEDTYNKARNRTGKTLQDVISRGFFSAADGIHINLEQANNITVYHEAAHAVIAAVLRHNPSVLSTYVDQLKNKLPSRMVREYDRQTSVYADSGRTIVNEEFIVRYLADVAAGKFRRQISIMGTTRRFFRSILSRFGLAEGVRLKTTDDIIVFAGKFHESLTSGIPLLPPEAALRIAVQGIQAVAAKYFPDGRVANLLNNFVPKNSPIIHDDRIIEELSAKGKRLGLENAFAESLWERQGFNTKTEGNPKKLEEFARIELNTLVERANGGEFIVQELTDSVLQMERKIAFNEGRNEVVARYDAILQGDTSQRRELLNELQASHQASLDAWIAYLNNNNGYTNAFKLYVLTELTGKVQQIIVNQDGSLTTKLVKRTPQTVSGVPAANAAALAELQTKDTADFWGLYPSLAKENIIKHLTFKESLTGTDGKWIVFPKQSDSAALSNFVQGCRWCTKDQSHAMAQLQGGDFHVFATKDKNGQYSVPRIAIRMLDGAVEEVRGVADENQNLEQGMLTEAHKRYTTLPGGEKWVKKDADMQRLTRLYEKTESSVDLSVNDLRFLYEIDSKIQGFGYSPDERIEQLKKKRNQTQDYARIYNVKVSQVFVGDVLDGQYFDEFINSKDIKVVTGKVVFTGSQITNLGNLASIGGGAYFEGSQITNLGNLKSIGGKADFKGSQVTNLGNLESIGGGAYFRDSQITNLGNLESIGGGADFRDSQVTNLGNLASINGSAYFKGSQVTNLGNLESIGNFADFRGSQITDLGNLESIGESAYFSGSQITNLGNLESIGDYADFSGSQITNLGNLTSIGGYADFKDSQITDLGNLESIGGSANFRDSQITDLGNLESIGGFADFKGSQITNLGNLESIGGYAYFEGSQITNLGNLKSIGGYAYFKGSQVTNLGNLESIGGFADFSGSQITNLGNLTSIGGYADFKDSQITNLGNLTSIGDYANFEGSQVTNLGNLKSIGDNAYFKDSQVTNLGNLESIGGGANFEGSQITDLGNLESIGGGAYFEGSQVTNLGNLKSINGQAVVADDYKDIFEANKKRISEDLSKSRENAVQRQGNEELRAVREVGNVTLQKELTSAHTEDVITQINSNIQNFNLELNEAGAEAVRRLMGERAAIQGNPVNDPTFDGIVLDAPQIINLVNIGRKQILPKLKAAGYTPLQTENFENLLTNLETVANLNKDFAVMYVYDDALEEELTHQEDLRASRTDDKALTILKTLSIWLNPGAKFLSQYGNLSDADKASEILAKLYTGQEGKYGWDKLPDFENTRKAFYKAWIDGIIRKNADRINTESLETFFDTFKRIGGIYAKTQETDTGRSETVPGKTGVQRGTSQGVQTDKQEARAGASREQSITGRRDKVSDRPAKVPTSTKERGTIKSAHEYGLINKYEVNGELRYYLEKSRVANQREAQEYVELVGFETAYTESLMPAATGNLRVHGSLQMAVIQLLDRQAKTALNAGNMEAFDYYQTKMAAVFHILAPEGTDAGQFSSQLAAWNITNPHTIVNFVKFRRAQAGLQPTIPADLQRQLENVALEKQEAEAEIAALTRQLEQALESQKRNAKTPLNRVKRAVLKTLSGKAKEAITRLRENADIAMSAIDSTTVRSVSETEQLSPLQGEILEDLRNIGAWLLLERWHGDPITVEQFQKEIIKIIGKQFAPYVEQVHAESVVRLDRMIEDERRSETIRKLQEQYPDKPETEINDLAEKAAKTRQAEHSRRARIRAEHKRIAKYYFAPGTRPKTSQQKVLEFIDEAEKIDPQAEPEVVIAAAAQKFDGLNSFNDLFKFLRQRFPERFEPRISDTPTDRKNRQEDAASVVAKSRDLFKKTNKALMEARRIERDAETGVTPEIRKRITEAKERNREATVELDKSVKTAIKTEGGVLKAIATVSRAAKVALIQTAVTNLFSTKVEQKIMEAPIDTIDIWLQRLFPGLENEGLSADGSITTAWYVPGDRSVFDKGIADFARGMSKHEILLRVLDEHPEFFVKFFGDFSPDFHTGVRKTLDKVMIPMRLQEFFMRDSAAIQALAQRAAMKGLNFKDIIANNEYDVFTEDDIAYALKRSLTLTYALRAGTGTGLTDKVFGAIVSTMQSSGFLDLLGAETFPFINFMYNTVNKYKTKIPIMAQARLTGKTLALAGELKKAGEPDYIVQAVKQNWTSTQIANQMWGVTALGIMMAAVRSLGDRDEWYLFRIPWTQGMGREAGSLYFDIRTQPMLAPIAFVANKMNRILNGKDMFTYGNPYEDLAEGFLGTSYRQAIEWNQLFNALWYSGDYLLTTAKSEEDIDRVGERASAAFQRWLGSEFGTLTNFLQFKTIKDIAAQIDQIEKRPLNLDDRPFLDTLTQRVPESRRILQDVLKLQVEARKNYATDKEEVRTPLPALKVLGFNLRDEADLRKEPTHAEMTANKLRWGKSIYSPPVLADEKRIAKIKRDFRREGEKLDPKSEEAKQLAKKLAALNEDLRPGQIRYALQNLFTSDLQDNFKALDVEQSMRVWQAATAGEKKLLTPIFTKKLVNAVKDKKKSKTERIKAHQLLKDLKLIQPKNLQ